MTKVFKLLIFILLLGAVAYMAREKLPAFFYNRACQDYDRGDYLEAANNFKLALKVNPSVARIHFALADTYMELKQPDPALEEYRKTIQFDPAFVKAYAAIADIYARKRNFEGAVELLRNAKKSLPGNREIGKLEESFARELSADNLAQATDLLMAGKKQEAAALIKKAIEATPDSSFAYYIQGSYYFMEHSYEEAKESLEKAIQIDPRFWPAQKLLGDIYFSRGDYGNAASNYRATLEYNRSDPTVLNDLAISLMQLERYGEALPYLKEAVDLEPGNANIRFSLASTYRDNGLFEEAASEYQKLIRDHPDYPGAHNELANIYKQQNKKKEAYDEYQKEASFCRERLRLDPDDPVALNDLAVALNGSGKYEEAEETAKRLVVTHPDYRQAYLTLATIYETTHRLEEAKKMLEKAKTLSTETGFIEKGIALLEKRPGRAGSKIPDPDTLYLKSGRIIRGRIKEEDAQRVIIEVALGDTTGMFIFYRGAIEKISRGRAR